MILIIKWAIMVLLFSFCCIWIHGLLCGAVQMSNAKSRLTYFRRGTFSRRVNRYLHRPILLRHIADSLETLQLPGRIGGFLMVSLILTTGGILAGGLVFQSFKGIIISGLMAGTLPYLILRIRLINLRMRTRIEFLPAVEVFYQTYILTGHFNIRTVLRDVVGSKGIGYPMKPIFDQLYRNLMIHREVDDGLRIFTLSLGNPWAEYFAGILRFGLLEGVDITANMQELIGDMRKAQLSDQMARNRLLEIRIANFTPPVFMLLLLGLNFKINYHNAYFYYLVDPRGRDMLLDSIILIFASFLMGVYLSMKRM